MKLVRVDYDLEAQLDVQKHAPDADTPYWFVTADVRITEGWGDKANHRLGVFMRSLGFEVDPEMACFFAYPKDESEADLVINLITAYFAGAMQRDIQVQEDQKVGL